MSNYLVRETANLFDPATGAWIGVKDANGGEQLVPSVAGVAALPTDLGVPFQGLVSGASDVLAKWYVGGYAGKSIGWWGDSTTFQFSTTLIKDDGSFSAIISPELSAAGVRMYNRGSNGATLEALMNTASPPLSNTGLPCDIASISALGLDAWVICAGINSCRTDATIIGSYGSAGQLAKAASLRAQFVSAVAQIRAVKPAAVIVWRMPNAHTAGSASFANSVTAQHCMDVYKLTYRGDSKLGLPSLAELVSNSVLFDTIERFYSETMYASGATPPNGYMHSDGLHPSPLLYELALADICRIFTNSNTRVWEATYAKPDVDTMLSRYRGKRYPIKPSTLKDYLPVAVVQVRTDSISGSSIRADIYEATTGRDLDVYKTFIGASAPTGQNYGTADTPGLCLGDIVEWRTPSGSLTTPITVLSNVSNGYVWWTTGMPDGTTYNSAELPIGSLGFVYRRKDLGCRDISRLLDNASTPLATGLGIYPITVISAAVGSIEVRGMRAFGIYKSLAGKAVAVTDKLILGGVTPQGGLLLTGATWTPHASDPGRGTITLAGYDFRNPNAQGAVLSAT